MKVCLFLISLFLSSTLIKAQAPQGIKYQAAVRNNQGIPIKNKNVGIKLSVLSTSSSGSVDYSERHLVTTNTLGLFDIVIGKGIPLNNTFSGITWNNGDKFVKIEIDTTGGTNYFTMGTSQLMSVPYALFAETANSTVNITNDCLTTPLIPDGICNVENKLINLIPTSYTVPAGKNLYISEISYGRTCGGDCSNKYFRIRINGNILYNIPSTIANINVFAKVGSGLIIGSNSTSVCETNGDMQPSGLTTHGTISGFLVDSKVSPFFITADYTVPQGKTFVEVGTASSTFPNLFGAGQVVTASSSNIRFGYLK